MLWHGVHCYSYRVLDDMAATSTAQPKVALCLAGALRDVHVTWPSIRDNIVDPTGASVFVAISIDAHVYNRSAHTGQLYAGKQPSETVSAAELAAVIGPRLRGAVVWDHAALLDLARIGRFAGKLVANAAATSGLLFNWIWYLKRWACQSLVAADPRGPYDIVVSARPDLVVFRVWRFAFDGDRAASRFSLSIGDERPIRFGDREVVMPDDTSQCVNDWMAVSTFAASTTLEQLVHHAWSTHGFRKENRMACRREVRKGFHDGSCCELVMATFLWRVGMPRQVANLHVGLSKYLPARERFSSAASFYEKGAAIMRERVYQRKTNDLSEALCAHPAFRHFGQISVKNPLPLKSGIWVDVGLLEQRKHIGNAVHGTNASAAATPKYHAAQGIGTKPVVFTCPSASIPRCDPNRTYQLKQPLTACFPNDYKYNLTRRTTGYGAPFPWWLLCSKPSCEPLPNVTFRFAAGRGMEAAVVFAHKGAARAVPSTVVV